jgi:serine protease Do
MLDPVRAKARILGLTTATFFGGVLLASGMEWTTGSHAATLLQQPPARSEVRPVAELSEAFVAISEAVTPAVVSIYTERTQRLSDRQRAIPEQFRDLFGLPRGDEEGEEVPMPGSGSGFLITRDGYVMTNNHVVEGAETITVTLQDRSVHQARLVGRDPTTDVAVIKLEGNDFPAVRFGDPYETKVGEWVLAIGNPLGLDFTVTAGIVSAKGRPLQILQNNLEGEAAGYAVESFIQTDAAINPGNSGGPLVNIDGEVIGINSAIASQTGYNAGYGFAVPIDLARRVSEDLMRYGVVKRPILGVSIREVNVEDAEYYDLPAVGGVMVEDFSMSDSPAERAGLRSGDVIVAVNGKPVMQVNELQREILTHRPGDEVEVEVIRGGERRRLRVRLVEATGPVFANRDAAPSSRGTVSGAGRLGLSVSPLTPELTEEYGIEGAEGLVITDVEQYSVAGRTRRVFDGMRILSVDGRRVTTPQEFGRALEGKRPGEVVELTLLQRTGRRSLLTLRVPENGNGAVR